MYVAFKEAHNLQKVFGKKDLVDGYIRMLQIRDFTQPEKNNVEYIPYKKL